MKIVTVRSLAKTGQGKGDSFQLYSLLPILCVACNPGLLPRVEAAESTGQRGGPHPHLDTKKGAKKEICQRTPHTLRPPAELAVAKVVP